MIAKGNQRSGGAQLATHLLNAHDNERVEVLEVRGSIANDLHGAFTEWHAQSKATGCTQYLYSLSVNPDQKQGHLTREQYLDFLSRVEQRLGLQSQGRAVVFHWKKDRNGEAREHCHAVWSRIDPQAGRAINLSHDHMKLRSVAQEFAKEHERQLPPGMQENHGEDRHDNRAGHANLGEKQQEERTGISKEERQAVLGKLWQQMHDGPSFVQGMKEAGYSLACGDKRAYVVIDRAGEVHSLSRQLAGVKAKTLKARLAETHPADRLPSVDEVRAEMAAQRENLRGLSKQPAEAPATDVRRAQLAARHEARRQELAQQRATMTKRHATERLALEGLRETLPFSRALKQGGRRGVSLLVRHIASRYERHQQTRALDRRQKNERHELVRQERKTKSLDAREKRSLEIRIGREDFQHLAKEIKRRDAILARPVSSRPIDRQPDARPQERAAIPTMSPADRRSRLQVAFSAEKTPSLPRTREEKMAGILRGPFGGATVPEQDIDRPDRMAEEDRRHERERQRLLDAFRHDR